MIDEENQTKNSRTNYYQSYFWRGKEIVILNRQLTSRVNIWNDYNDIVHKTKEEKN